MGWSKKFRDYSFPILETLRPIPILAWVPLAILAFLAVVAGGQWPISKSLTLVLFPLIVVLVRLVVPLA